jgi:hypothetical protein
MSVQNCIICSAEFDTDELQSQASSVINQTRFKICEECIGKSDPAQDYDQVRKIVSQYLWSAEAADQFNQANKILDGRSK